MNIIYRIGQLNDNIVIYPIKIIICLIRKVDHMYPFMDKRLASKIPGTPEYQKKRLQENKKRELFLLNQQLQREISMINHKIRPEHKENDRYKKLWKKANKYPVHSSIFPLRYRNNFEKYDVANAGIELCFSLTEHFLEKSEEKFFFNKIKQLQYRLKQLN